METKKVLKATTAEEARQFAIDWQTWQFTQRMSLSELIEWEEAISKLAEKFDLVDEFKENGII